MYFRPRSRTDVAVLQHKHVPTSRARVALTRFRTSNRSSKYLGLKILQVKQSMTIVGVSRVRSHHIAFAVRDEV